MIIYTCDVSENYVTTHMVCSRTMHRHTHVRSLSLSHTHTSTHTPTHTFIIPLVLEVKNELVFAHTHTHTHTGCGKSPWVKIKSEFTRSLNGQSQCFIVFIVPNLIFQAAQLVYQKLTQFASMSDKRAAIIELHRAGWFKNHFPHFWSKKVFTQKNIYYIQI